MINKVEKHDTDHECNVCGEEEVINQHGSIKCDNRDCAAARIDTAISWNSTEEEIEEWRSDQNTAFRVFTKAGYTDVEAERFEVEGGALIFYRSEDSAKTLGKMSADEQFRAFNEWNEVKKL